MMDRPAETATARRCGPWLLRPVREADGLGVHQLLVRCLPATEREEATWLRRWAWRSWRNPWRGESPAGWVLDRDGQIDGHLGVVHVPMRISDTSRRGAIGVDFAVAPDTLAASGVMAGLELAQAFFSSAGDDLPMATTANDKTAAVFGRFGCKPVPWTQTLWRAPVDRAARLRAIWGSRGGVRRRLAEIKGGRLCRWAALGQRLIVPARCAATRLGPDAPPHTGETPVPQLNHSGETAGTQRRPLTSCAAPSTGETPVPHLNHTGGTVVPHHQMQTVRLTAPVIFISSPLPGGWLLESMPVEAWSSNLAWSSLAPVAAIAAGVDQGPHWWRWRYVDDPQGDQLVVLRAVHRVSGRSAAAVVGWQDGADGRRAYIEEIWGDLSDGRVLAGLMAAAMAWAETQGAEALVAAAGGADWQGRWSAMGFERRQRTAPAWTLHTRSAGVDESELSRRAMFHHGLMF